MRKGGPIIDADLIGTLRARVIAHNSTPGSAPVKLNALKQIYQRGWRGREPAAHALSKVDEYLGQRLAKAAEFDETEHPRAPEGSASGGQFVSSGGGAAPPGGGGGASPPRGGGGGPPSPPPSPRRRPPKAPLGLPASPQAHQALMDTNTGYQAFQTAVIPETRYGTSGAILRDLGSLALGTAGVISLYRGKPGGGSLRAARAIGGTAGSIVGGLTGAAGRGLRQAIVGGARRAVRAVPRTLTEQEQEKALTRAIIRSGAVRGQRLGARLAEAEVKALGWGTRKLVDAVGATGASPRSQATRRAATLAALGVASGYGLRNQIKGTPADPERIGATIDTYSARVVRKLGADAGLGDAHDALLKTVLAGADFNDLRKAIPAGAYSRIGQGLLSAAGSVAGAIGGAAATTGALAAGRAIGSGGKTGNPYHDNKGRFTSQSQAQTTTRTIIGGGVAGAALGGLATYLAIKTHNTRVLGPLSRRVVEHANSLLSRAASPGGGGSVRRMIQAQASTIGQRIEARVSTHPELLRAQQATAELGASAPLRYKVAMQDHLHNRIAEAGAFQADFQVPKFGRSTKALRGKAGDAWETVGAIKDAIPGTRRTAAIGAAANRIRSFLKNANDEQFNRAIENLTGEQKTTARGFWNAAKTAPATVDTQLAEHHAAIATAKAHADTLGTAREAASRAHADAEAVYRRQIAGTEEHTASATRMEAAAAARDQARAAHEAAQAAHAQLKSAEPTVVTPFGAPIQPANTDQTVGEVRQALIDRYTKTETRAYAKQVERARHDQIAALVERKHRQLGAQAVLRVRAGATGGGVGPSARALDRAERGIKSAQTGFDQAVSRHATNTVRMDALKQATDGKVPRGMSQADVKDLLTRQAGVTADHATSEAAVAAARSKLALAMDTRNTLTAPFEAAVTTPAAGFHLLPASVRDNMTRDLGMARQTMSGVTGRILARPTARNMADYVKAVPGRVKAGASTLWHDALYPPGSNQISWRRAATSAVIAGTLGETVAVPLYGYARDKLAGKPSKFPRHLIQPQLRIDPITGAGYVTVSTPHPTDANDRMVVWGAHGQNADAPDKRLQAGGRLSAVESAFQQGRLSGRQPGTPGSPQAASTGQAEMPGDLRNKIDGHLTKLRSANAIDQAQTFPDGPFVEFRKPDDKSEDGNAAAGDFMGHMKKSFLSDNKTLGGGQYWRALRTMASDQGAGITPRQAANVLTNADGRYQKSSIFAPGNWNSNDTGTITAQLASEVARAAHFNPTAEDITNLHRAVHKVAVAKNLTPAQTGSLHTSIRALGPTAAAAPRAATRPAMLGVRNYPMPELWREKQADFNQLAEAHGRQVAQAVGADFKGAHEAYRIAAGEFAKAVGHTHGLNLQSSFKVAHDTLATSPPGDIQAEDWKQNPYYAQLLDENAYAHLATLNRAAPDFDDLDAILAKAYDPSQRRDPRGSDAGGQWTSGGASAAVGAHPDSGHDWSMGGARGGGLRTEPKTAQPWITGNKVPDYHPLRASQDLASNAGMQAAWEVAGKILPSAAAVKATVATAMGSADGGLARAIAAKTLGNVAGGATAVGVGSVKLAAGIGGGAAALGLAQAGLHAAGYRLPGETEKPSIGRDLAGTAGSVLGGIGGGSLGIASGPGAFAAAVGGSWAGQLAGQHVYDWFAPYGAQQTARATARFTRSATA